MAGFQELREAEKREYAVKSKGGGLPMEVSFACYSAIGKRENNEDAYKTLQGQNSFIAIAADGVGGHACGEIASKAAVDAIADLLKDADLSEEILDDAILEADISVKQTHKPGMTTIAVLWLDGQNALVAHVGDTRVYHIRNGRIIFQTVDHSVSQIAVLAGEITPRDIRSHKDRNKLIRALGSPEETWADTCWLAVQPGDRFLLCSDGFWEPVTEETMLSSAAMCPDAESWLKDMRGIAELHASDNNTAIAIIVS